MERDKIGKRNKVVGRGLTVLCLLLVLATAFLVWYAGTEAPETGGDAAATDASLLPGEATADKRSPAPATGSEGKRQEDKLHITKERQGYEQKSLRLVIPKLDVDVPILDGVDTETLLQGAGLYDYADLPGEGDRNTSIAGCRNGLESGNITDNMPFFDIDTLKSGDYLYLVDAEYVYRYLFENQETVEEDDWDPIFHQGYPCITLTSCTPAGATDHRMIVRGRLDTTEKRTEQEAFLKAAKPLVEVEIGGPFVGEMG